MPSTNTPRQSPISSNTARLTPPSLDPVFYAVSAVDAAYIGACGIKDIAIFLAAIGTLASDTAPLDLTEAIKRLASIQRLASLAAQFADERCNTLGCELEESNCALQALTSGKEFN